MALVSRARPSLLATIAHELRNPTSALETAAELLERDLDGLEPQQVREMVSSIHRRAVWMRGLLENLLCNAAIDEGRLRVHLRPLDIVETINEVEAVVRPLFVRKQQSIRVITVAACPLVEADGHRITQVILNLLTNANKYASSGTDVDVAVSMRGGVVRVSVSDRGPGLPDDALRSVFRAYERAGREGGEGLGLGLWVVRSIVRCHGGRVGALNRDGGGATFWFELRPMRRQLTASAVIATDNNAAAERMNAV